MREVKTSKDKEIKIMEIKKIEINFSKRCGYSVEVNGETILECLSDSEFIELTVRERVDLYENAIRNA